MEGYDEATYGDRVAEVYDTWFGDLGDLVTCVDRLESLARSSHASAASPASSPLALELGVGTGRIALPLAARGLDVRGIDSSTAMLDVLRDKEGADKLEVGQGDMAEATVPLRSHEPAGNEVRADLVYVAYNTFFNLPGRDAQRRCLGRVASILGSGGRFLVEAFVPDLVSVKDNSVTVRSLAADRLVLTATVLDESAQTIAGQYVDITEAGIKLRPWLVHYLTPAQLDELAAGAGLELEARWADYAMAPFEPESSPLHVSVYNAAG